MSQLIIEGSIKKSFPEKEGIGIKGPWTSKEYLIVYGEGHHTKELILVAWNETIIEMEGAHEKRVKFHVEPTSRDSGKGYYFTSVKVWRVL